MGKLISFILFLYLLSYGRNVCANNYSINADEKPNYTIDEGKSSSEPVNWNDEKHHIKSDNLENYFKEVEKKTKERTGQHLPKNNDSYTQDSADNAQTNSIDLKNNIDKNSINNNINVNEKQKNSFVDYKETANNIEEETVYKKRDTEDNKDIVVSNNSSYDKNKNIRAESLQPSIFNTANNNNVEDKFENYIKVKKIKNTAANEDNNIDNENFMSEYDLFYKKRIKQEAQNKQDIMLETKKIEQQKQEIYNISKEDENNYINDNYNNYKNNNEEGSYGNVELLDNQYKEQKEFHNGYFQKNTQNTELKSNKFTAIISRLVSKLKAPKKNSDEKVKLLTQRLAKKLEKESINYHQINNANIVLNENINTDHRNQNKKTYNNNIFTPKIAIAEKSNEIKPQKNSFTLQEPSFEIKRNNNYNNRFIAQTRDQARDQEKELESLKQQADQRQIMQYQKTTEQARAKDLELPFPEKRSDASNINRNIRPPNIAQKKYDESNQHLTPVFFEGEIERNIFKYTADDRDIGIVKSIIAKIGKVEIMDENENSILMYAVNNKNYKLIVTLLEYGASPNKKNKEGFTPMHLASSYGDINIIYPLLFAGGI